MDNGNVNNVEFDFNFVKELLKSSSLDDINEEIKYDENIEDNE